MTNRLVIVGAGGHGREALAVARAVNQTANRWREVSFVDDGTVNEDRLARIEANLLGGLETLIVSGDEHVIAIGDPTARRRTAERIGDGSPAITLVDPSAWLGGDVRLDDGAMIYPGVICTTNVRIGLHSHANCGAIISHDCTIGDFVSISPGVRLNGDVTIEDDAFLGTGAIVLPGRTVGQGAIVAAGAVVVDDIAAGATVLGVPAR